MRVNIHEFYIKRCIELAKNALGTTYPNPGVGAVIVHDGRIIGEGYTSLPGQHHAEVNAINAVQDKSLLQRSTLYVSLEPCSHFGRTPPCADLIVKHKIPKVVIGTLDPNEKVAGRGILKLVESGSEVITGVLEDECRDSMKRFLCYHNRKRPYIILKWAESADGFVAPLRPEASLEEARPVWISNPYSRQLVHKWRSEEQAILAGAATLKADNPALNTRSWSGPSPLIAVIDREPHLPEGLKIFNGDSSVMMLTTLTEAQTRSRYGAGVMHYPLQGEQDIPEQLLQALYEKEVQSLIVEGGPKTLDLFIQKGLWDEARIFRGTPILGQGVKAPTLNGKIRKETWIGTDLLQWIYPLTHSTDHE